MTELTETIRTWDARLQEWITVTVPAAPAPKPARRHAHKSRPACSTPLSPESPLADWWRYTAYAPGEPLADMRSYVKPASMRTHRAAAVAPGAELGTYNAGSSGRLDV